MTPVIARSDNAAHVGRALGSSPISSAGRGWTPERAIMHRLASPPPVSPQPDDVPVRLLRPDDSLDHLPAGLRFEMTHARAAVPVAAAWIDDRPVAFCYPCWITETLWDVSIDTLRASSASRTIVLSGLRGGSPSRSGPAV